jgi:hypothetical protein
MYKKCYRVHITGTCDNKVSNFFSIIFLFHFVCVKCIEEKEVYLWEKGHNGTISLHTRETNHVVSFHNVYFLQFSLYILSQQFFLTFSADVFWLSWPFSVLH